MTTHEAKAFVGFIRTCLKGKKDVEQLSFRQMAILTNVSSPTLCRFFSGRMPDVVTFLVLLDWLGETKRT